MQDTAGPSRTVVVAGFAAVLVLVLLLAFGCSTTDAGQPLLSEGAIEIVDCQLLNTEQATVVARATNDTQAPASYWTSITFFEGTTVGNSPDIGSTEIQFDLVPPGSFSEQTVDVEVRSPSGVGTCTIVEVREL